MGPRRDHQMGRFSCPLIFCNLGKTLSTIRGWLRWSEFHVYPYANTIRAATAAIVRDGN